MLPFFSGGNPFSASADQVLAAQAAQAPADPQTTGAVAAPAPAPATPAPADNSPSFQDRISNAFSGRGFFGSTDLKDEIVDPNTGISPADRRAMGAQSMMKMGLLFLAAGARQTSDQRAAILAKAPELLGSGSGDLNSFAKSRLEMAKLKLEQRKQQMEEQTGQQQIQMLRELAGGGAPAAPSAGAQAVQTAQTGLQATGQALGAGDTSGAPAPVGGAPQAAPGPLAVQPLTPQGNALAPGGVPRGPLLSRADAAGVLASPTVAGRGAALQQAIQNAQSRQDLGPVEYDQGTGQYRAPKIDGRGRIVGYEMMGKPESMVQDTAPDKEGNQYRETYHINPITGQKVITARSDIAESPAAAREAQANIGILRDNAKDLKGTYQDTIQGGVQRYDKLAKVREDVLAGKGIFGTGAETATSLVKGLATAGLISPRYAQDLITNDNFMRASKDSVADVIRNFNGSQGVSNADREFAAAVVGASLNGTRDQVINSLTNNMADIRNSVNRYNDNARGHNDNLKALPESTQKLLKLNTVDRNFDTEESDFANRYNADLARRTAEYEGKPKPDAAPAIVPQAIDLLKSDPGKYRSFFDKKYGAGAAAKILGK